MLTQLQSPLLLLGRTFLSQGAGGKEGWEEAEDVRFGSEFLLYNIVNSS